MSYFSIVTTLFCLVAVGIEAFYLSDEKAIFVTEKPQGVILQDGYQIISTAPSDLSVVFSQSFQQIVEGVSTALHAAVEYLQRVVG